MLEVRLRRRADGSYVQTHVKMPGKEFEPDYQEFENVLEFLIHMASHYESSREAMVPHISRRGVPSRGGEFIEESPARAKRIAFNRERDVILSLSNAYQALEKLTYDLSKDLDIARPPARE